MSRNALYLAVLYLLEGQKAMKLDRKTRACLMLLAILSLAALPLLTIACSNTPKGEVISATYAYQEKRIDLPSGTSTIMSMEHTDKGRLLIVGSNGDGSSQLVWELCDTSAWKAVCNIRELLTLSESQMVASVAITKAEEILVVATDAIDIQGKLELYLIELEPEPEYRRLNIDVMEALGSRATEASVNTITTLLPLNKGQFVIQDYANNLLLIDSNDETIVLLESEEKYRSLRLMSAASHGDKTIALCQDDENGNHSVYYFLESATKTFAKLDSELLEALSSSLEESAKLSHLKVLPNLDSNSSILDRATVCLNNGVFELSDTGLNIIVDAEETVLANPALITIGCIFDSEDSFFLVCVNPSLKEDIFSIYRYERDYGSMEKAVTLQVYSLRDSAEVRQAISFFKSENAQVDVKLSIGLSSDETTVEDALLALNTELLAGAGPDIIFLDGLPAQEYIDKGVLQNLSSIYNEAVQSGNFYENIIGTYVYNGECWALPMRFSFPTIVAPREIASRAGSLLALTDLVGDMIGENRGSSVFCNQAIHDAIFIATYPELLEGGKLNEDALIIYFQSIRGISLQLESVNEQVCLHSLLAESSLRDECTHSREFHFGVKSFLTDPNQILITSVLNETNFGYINAAQESIDRDVIIEVLMPEERKCFVPSTVAAINSASGKIELAEEFIRLMLDDYYQNSSQNEGLSINKSVIESRTSEAYAIFFTADDYIFSDAFSGETLSFYTTMFSSLDTPVIVDNRIHGIIFKQLHDYLDGSATLEEAVAACATRVDLYLVE
ncbi:MAG: hypothetical protein FWD27_01955 [Coriobacteriia bacterium]|nr:hypothetical protein [Coriobacteriia bacterium]